jgi:hypothetical protein
MDFKSLSLVSVFVSSAIVGLQCKINHRGQSITSLNQKPFTTEATEEHEGKPKSKLTGEAAEARREGLDVEEIFARKSMISKRLIVRRNTKAKPAKLKITNFTSFCPCAGLSGSKRR